MKDLKALIPYLLGHKGQLLFGIAMTMIATLLSLVQPYLLGTAIDDLQHNRPVSDVYWLAGLILGLAVAQGVFVFFTRYNINRVARYVEYELRRDFFTHLERMPQSFFQEMHTGDIMARATNDIVRCADFWGRALRTRSIRC